MIEIAVTNHAIVRAGERLFSHNFKGRSDDEKVKNDRKKGAMLAEFLRKSVTPVSSTLMKNTVYRAMIDGFDNFVAVVIVSDEDINVHKIITIKEIR